MVFIGRCAAETLRRKSMDDPFEAEFFSRNVPGSAARLKRCTVGIVGAGGLGSNAAHALVRAGVGRLIAADPDGVELSNLNRQLFFRDQAGRPKVEALAETLGRISPQCTLDFHAVRITPDNLLRFFGEADLLIEALDRAESKAELIEAWLRQTSGRYIVAASGLAGIGKTEDLKVRRLGRLILCGDGLSDMATGLCSARVALVASMQANIALSLLLAADS